MQEDNDIYMFIGLIPHSFYFIYFLIVQTMDMHRIAYKILQENNMIYK